MTPDPKSPEAPAAETRLLEFVRSIFATRSRRTWHGRTDADVAADIQELFATLARERGQAELQRTAREQAEAKRNEYWLLLCKTVEAMGKISPEAAPFADQWAAELAAEARRLREAIVQARRELRSHGHIEQSVSLALEYIDTALAQPAGEAGKEGV